MDTSTLVMSHMVLREGSVRSVARKLSRPVSTVSDAISRLEQALAIPLVSRSNGVLVKSLVADIRSPQAWLARNGAELPIS